VRTPVFADPGKFLVKAALEADYVNLIVVPGVTSIMTALVRSGFDIDQFLFAGFLDRDRSVRFDQIIKLRDEPRTVVLLETPYRLMPVLEAFKELMPERRAYIGCNLTMKFETHHYGTFEKLYYKFENMHFKGEFVIVFEKNFFMHQKGYRIVPSNAENDHRAYSADESKFRDRGERSYSKDSRGRSYSRGSSGGRPYSKDSGKGSYSKGSYSKGSGGKSYSKDSGRGSYSKDSGRGSYSKDSGRGSYSKDSGRGSYSKDSGRGSYSKGSSNKSYSKDSSKGSYSKESGGKSYNKSSEGRSYNKSSGKGKNNYSGNKRNF
jgi:uncharacterized membrane protein YgcG